MRAIAAPRAFRQSHESGWMVTVEIFAASNQLQRRLRFGILLGNALQPLRPFKPPMAKKLGIKRRRQDRRRPILAVARNYPRGDIREVARMIVCTCPRPIREVRGLGSLVSLGVGHLPVAMPPRPALFVKVEI